MRGCFQVGKNCKGLDYMKNTNVVTIETFVIMVLILKTINLHGRYII